MRYAPHLKPGGSIGFLAPSFGCATEPYLSAFNNALKTFQGLGYQTILGPNCYESSGLGISNSPALCGRELNESVLSKESDVLISCGGGELMCEVVPYMDFEAIKSAPPKWYMGYSDNTNYTFLSATLADTAAIYGPCAPSFGMEPWHPCLWDAMDLLSGKIDQVHGYPAWEIEGIKDEEHPLAPYNPTVPTRYALFAPENGSLVPSRREFRLSGRLLGGCLDILTLLLGTRFDSVKDFAKRYEGDGILWFLEACDLNVLSIRRALWQMREAGWFEGASGFLIGRPLHYDEPILGLDRHRAVTDILAPLGVPVVMDLDFGHLPPAMPIVTGAPAKACASEEAFSMKFSFY